MFFKGPPKIRIIALFILLHFITSENRVGTAAQLTENPLRSHGLGSAHYEPNLNCTQTTLKRGDYEIFSNGSLHVKSLNLLLDTGSYIKRNDSVTFCSNRIEMSADKIIGRYTVALYFAFVVFMMHFQIPVLFCLGKFGFVLLPFVFTVLLISVATVGFTGTEEEFNNTWRTVTSVLSFLNVSILGWMSLFSCSIVIAVMKRLGYIAVSKTKIIVQDLKFITSLGITIGVILSALTLTMHVFGVVEGFSGLEYVDKMSPDVMLVFFAPATVFLTIVNGVLIAVSCFHCYSIDPDLNDFLLGFRGKHRKYSTSFLISVAVWWLGCFSVVYGDWAIWQVFVVFNFVFPIFYMREFADFKGYSFETNVKKLLKHERYSFRLQFGSKFINCYHARNDYD